MSAYIQLGTVGESKKEKEKVAPSPYEEHEPEDAKTLEVRLKAIEKVEKAWKNLSTTKKVAEVTWRQIGWLLCPRCSYVEFPGCFQDRQLLNAMQKDESGDVGCVACSMCDESTDTCTPWMMECRSCRGPKVRPELFNVNFPHVEAVYKAARGENMRESDINVLLHCPACLTSQFVLKPTGLCIWDKLQIIDPASKLPIFEQQPAQFAGQFQHFVPDCRGELELLPARLSVGEADYCFKNHQNTALPVAPTAAAPAKKKREWPWQRWWRNKRAQEQAIKQTPVLATAGETPFEEAWNTMFERCNPHLETIFKYLDQDNTQGLDHEELVSGLSILLAPKHEFNHIVLNNVCKNAEKANQKSFSLHEGLQVYNHLVSPDNRDTFDRNLDAAIPKYFSGAINKDEFVVHLIETVVRFAESQYKTLPDIESDRDMGKPAALQRQTTRIPARQAFDDPAAPKRDEPKPAEVKVDINPSTQKPLADGMTMRGLERELFASFTYGVLEQILFDNVTKTLAIGKPTPNPDPSPWVTGFKWAMRWLLTLVFLPFALLGLRVKGALLEVLFTMVDNQDPTVCIGPCKQLGFALLFVLFVPFYYIPTAILVLYYGYVDSLDRISILEVWVPFLLMAVTALLIIFVFPSSERVGVNGLEEQEKERRENMWMKTKLDTRARKIDLVWFLQWKFEDKARHFRYSDIVGAKRRFYSPYWWQTILLMLIAAAHSIIPGVYRVIDCDGSVLCSGDHPFLGAGWAENLVVIGNIIVCFPTITILAIILQSAWLMAYRIVRVQSRVAEFTNPHEAAENHLPCFLDLGKAENLEFWLLLRDYARRVVTKGHFGWIMFLIGLTLLLNVILLISIFVRVVILAYSFDIFNVLSVYDIAVMSVFLLTFLLVIVRANTIMRQVHMDCLERVRFALARRVNFLREERDFNLFRRRQMSVAVDGSDAHAKASSASSASQPKSPTSAAMQAYRKAHPELGDLNELPMERDTSGVMGIGLQRLAHTASFNKSARFPGPPGSFTHVPARNKASDEGTLILGELKPTEAMKRHIIFTAEKYESERQAAVDSVLLLDSAIGQLKTLDEPISVFYIPVDKDFLFRLGSLVLAGLGAGLTKIFFQF